MSARGRPGIATPSGEPVAGPWRARPLTEMLADIRTVLTTPVDRPLILAVDGRSASGKTTIAKRLAALVTGSAVVHSDDVGWWESFFGWDHLMASGVLEPLRRSDDVRYRPPAWDLRHRIGAIEVPATAALVLIEGVGVSRRSLAPLIDGALWVQSDMYEARRRGLQRDGDTQADIDFWDAWDREELAFLAADRPWERALAVLCGTPSLADVAIEHEGQVLIGRSLRP